MMSPYDSQFTMPEPLSPAALAPAKEQPRDETRFQHTLAGTAQCTGIGVHSGEKMTLRILPAPENHGIVFLRTDLRNGARTIPARWDTVIDTQLCTVVGNDHGGKVATIEHLMAALGAFGVDNALIEIDGPEVPVMDGSASSFVFLLEMAGLQAQSAPRKEIIVLKPVELTHKQARVALLPDDIPSYSMDIAFPTPVIREQHYDFELSRIGFKSEISRARTFGFFEEAEMLKKMGLGRGGSLENAVIIKDDKIMNEEGLRYGNEFVRHKLLDAIGDLTLAGGKLCAKFEGICSGHAMNNKLLRALFADSSAYRIQDSAR